MNQLQIFKSNNELTLDSREVAEMVEKNHAHLLRDIETYKEYLGESKIGFTDFFISSTYISNQNRELPNYHITKKGCEFIAHKLTGQKGAIFTATYINRFHDLERTLKEKANPIQIDSKFMYQLAQSLEEKEKQIEEMKQKALFAEAVEVSKNSILVEELAKILKQNGIEIGQNRLFTWLRNNGYLCKVGENYNLPTQYAMELNLFEIKKTTINTPDGSVRVTRTTKVTGKGQIYFVNKFKATA